MSRTYKITTIGDIMCEPPMLAQVTKGDGTYDFKSVFAPLKSYFDEADYVIGNLETPLAGEEAGYTDCLVAFNTPDEIAKALKELGMDAVSTANNHCCDRGQAGLVRTLKVLDEIGLAHTGTYADPDEKDRILYFTVGDTKIAMIAYTYAYNKPLKEEWYVDDALERCVNRLRPLRGNMKYVPNPPILQKARAFVEEVAGRKLIWEENIKLKKIIGVPVAYADDLNEWEKYEKYVGYLQEDIEEAKKHADLVFFLPHVGGQFNVEPGMFSSYIVYQGVKLGADLVLAAHSHTTQKAAYLNGVPCFYSLGNVTMWPHSTYSVVESLPEYGLAAHTYVQDGKIVKNGFSVFKMVQDEGVPLSVIPCDELYGQLTDPGEKAKLAEEVGAIYARVTGKEAPAAIQREYEL